MITERRLPACFAFLARDKNVAVDAALVECLPDLEDHAQNAALSLLAKRGDAQILAGLVEQIDSLDEPLCEKVTNFAPDISPALRKAVSASNVNVRLAAINLVDRSGHPKLASVLAEAICNRDAGTRELAATSLGKMIDLWLTREPQAPSVVTGEKRAEKTEHFLKEAVDQLIERWDTHREPSVLDAAMKLGERVMPGVCNKISKSRSKFADNISERFRQPLGAHGIRFAVRCLAIEGLRGAAARSLSRVTEPAEVESMLEAEYLLADPAIQQGAKAISRLKWISQAVTIAAEKPQLAPAIVRWLRCCGMTDEQKFVEFGSWLATSCQSLLETTIWNLLADESERATSLLQVYGARREGRLVVLVKRELRRRRLQQGLGARPTVASTDNPDAPDSNEQLAKLMNLLHECWDKFDDLDDAARAKLRSSNPFPAPILNAFLRGKLASSHAWERSRALHMAICTNAITSMGDHILRLAHDQDDQIRSMAVKVLANFPGASTARVLRQALKDKCPRVQANAIEAMEKLDISEREEATVEMLESSNGRVRANAIKSLLKMELEQAGEALLDMLEDDSVDHRTSALWVVAKLELGSLIKRIEHMAAHDDDLLVRVRASEVLNGLSNSAGQFTYGKERQR